ncbi:unnamed protein product [Spirodela intermedia]|uniref:Uncharacterized protein n=1 Tax=Spirodela intermedia TaxID=51605 RepID=A0A7I8IU09_SPIIN|nr:unnamed protein product [Spirodela intermedia]CAA6661514.1 unnamed protein product [Spirodela intermedia]
MATARTAAAAVLCALWAATQAQDWAPPAECSNCSLCGTYCQETPPPPPLGSVVYGSPPPPSPPPPLQPAGGGECPPATVIQCCPNPPSGPDENLPYYNYSGSPIPAAVTAAGGRRLPQPSCFWPSPLLSSEPT